MSASLGRNCSDQALGPGADQIFPVGGDEGLPHQIVVLGIPVLDQRPLHGLSWGSVGT